MVLTNIVQKNKINFSRGIDLHLDFVLNIMYIWMKMSLAFFFQNKIETLLLYLLTRAFKIDKDMPDINDKNMFTVTCSC